MKRWTKIGLATAGVLGAIQLVPLPHDNPPVTGEISAPPEVMSILKRSCYDCHSNQTVWPWYSRVAPMSWLVYRDVVEGREHLNFSEWTKLPAEKQAKKTRGSAKLAQKGAMPLWFYLPLHQEARLSDADKHTLNTWAGLVGGDGK